MPIRSRGRTVTLRDGVRVRLRPIIPADKSLLAESFERLSAQSRFRRFLTAKDSLSAAELDYLVDDVDHSDHEAIAAFDHATGAMLGIARYVRSKEDPEVAEVAVTVTDDWQRRGLGRALLDRVTYRARREGIRRFSALVLGENRPALGLLADLGEAQRRSGATEVELLIELPPERGIGAQLGRALRAAGAGSLLPARTLAQRVVAGVALNSPPPRHAGPIRTIVVDLDSGPGNDEVLRGALELAAHLEGLIHVVSAYSGVGSRARAEVALAAARQMAADAGLEVVTHALRGDAADALASVAFEQQADLIVVGELAGRGKRFLAGSVSDRVSHHAPCSVLILRASPGDGEDRPSGRLRPAPACEAGV